MCKRRSCDQFDAAARDDPPSTHERRAMRTQSIDANRARPYFGLAVAAIGVVMLTASNAVAAQERSAGAVQASPAMLLAIIRPIDPIYLDLNRADGTPRQDRTSDSTTGERVPIDVTAGRAAQPVSVGPQVEDPELWRGFRRSVSGAATSSCLGPDALWREDVAVEGLLRLPFLVAAASSGACR
jgi:hypothetical protein